MKHTQKPNRSRSKRLLSTAALIACLGSGTFSTISYADEAGTQVMDMTSMKKFFDGLDASSDAPKGLTPEYIAQSVKRAGGDAQDIAYLTRTMNADVCADVDISTLCNYMGRKTIYKVRNLAFKLKSSGVSDEAIMDAVAPVMEYGLIQNLENLYGEKGLDDRGFRDALKKQDARNPRDLQRKNREKSLRIDTKRLLCLGLKADIDTQTITTTNPVYGRKYRMVTCATGLNWRKSWKILWWSGSAQAGLSITHSRFARRIGLWHLTGADPSICATANAMGNSQTKCNNYHWSTPVALRANFLWNQSAGSVTASGHAHKLGHSFNTLITF